MNADMEKFANMRMDSRMVDEIRRSSTMSGEQGSGWLSDFGGSSGYMYWAKQPAADRLTYFAVNQGYTTPEDIAAAIDLSVKDVNVSLKALEAKGLVTGVVGESV